jgi:hypothetical protein
MHCVGIIILLSLLLCCAIKMGPLVLVLFCEKWFVMIHEKGENRVVQIRMVHK